MSHVLANILNGVFLLHSFVMGIINFYKQVHIDQVHSELSSYPFDHFGKKRTFISFIFRSSHFTIFSFPACSRDSYNNCFRLD